MAVAKACILISKDPTLFQHSFQHCVSSQHCVSAYVTLLCFSCYNTVFQHKFQLCFSIVFMHLCFSICVPSYVFQHLCFSICVSASVFHLLCSSICDSASVFQLCFSTVFQLFVSSSVFQHLCSIICVSASVFQHLCFSFCVPASVIELLCSSFVSALCFIFVFQLLCSSISCACSITNRFPSMTTLTICVISANVSPLKVCDVLLGQSYLWKCHVVYESRPCSVIINLNMKLYRIPKAVPPSVISLISAKKCRKVISQTGKFVFFMIRSQNKKKITAISRVSVTDLST
jgi:hypothetical protein